MGWGTLLSTSRTYLPLIAFMLGIAAGMCIETRYYWSIQEAYLKDILLRLSYLETELKQQGVVVKRKARKKSYPSLISYSNATGMSSSEDMFYDAESDLEFPLLSSASNKVIFDLSDVSEEKECDFNEVDKMLAEFRYDNAYVYCFQLLKNSSKLSLSTNCEFMWRWAKVCYKCYQEEAQNGNVANARDLLFKADAAATQALELNTKSSAAHKWRAIILGQIINTASIKEKVAGGFKFRDLVDRALLLDPLDPELHDLKGRWIYAISKVSWVERKTANYLFGKDAVPQMTLEDALASFNEARRLYPKPDPNNLLWTAKCYMELSKINEGVKLLHLASQVDVKDVLLSDCKNEIDKLLQAYT